MRDRWANCAACQRYIGCRRQPSVGTRQRCATAPHAGRAHLPRLPRTVCKTDTQRNRMPQNGGSDASSVAHVWLETAGSPQPERATIEITVETVPRRRGKPFLALQALKQPRAFPAFPLSDRRFRCRFRVLFSGAVADCETLSWLHGLRVFLPEFCERRALKLRLH